MSDETNNTAVAQNNDVIPVERNGVTINLVKTKLTKGKNKGQEYFSVPTNKEGRDTLMAWLGEDMWKLLIPKINNRILGLNDEATDDDNIFDKDKFASSVAAFSARGESKADLEAQVQDLLEETLGLDATKPENTVTIMANFAEIKSLQEAIASKKRERKPKSEGQQAATSSAPTTAS